jgi:hypothetical protein
VTLIVPVSTVNTSTVDEKLRVKEKSGGINAKGCGKATLLILATNNHKFLQINIVSGNLTKKNSLKHPS